MKYDEEAEKLEESKEEEITLSQISKIVENDGK